MNYPKQKIKRHKLRTSAILARFSSCFARINLHPPGAGLGQGWGRGAGARGQWPGPTPWPSWRKTIVVHPRRTVEHMTCVLPAFVQ